jgi:hypothetical protein
VFDLQRPSTSVPWGITVVGGKDQVALDGSCGLCCKYWIAGHHLQDREREEDDAGLQGGCREDGLPDIGGRP